MSAIEMASPEVRTTSAPCLTLIDSKVKPQSRLNIAKLHGAEGRSGTGTVMNMKRYRGYVGDAGNKSVQLPTLFPPVLVLRTLVCPLQMRMDTYLDSTYTDPSHIHKYMQIYNDIHRL